MSEETKKECCICNIIKCETCKKFLVVALGTFVGGFCALSLFAALHKPPMMHHHMHRHHMPMMEHQFRPHHHMHRGMKPHGDFRKFPDAENAEQLPIKEQKPEIKD